MRTWKARFSVVVLLSVLAGWFSPVLAAEVSVPVEPRGLRAVAVSFFTATPLGLNEAGEVRIGYGDLEVLRWDLATQVQLHTRVVVLNSSHMRLPTVDVRVSVYVGNGPLDSPIPLDKITAGAPGVVERLFFEGRFEIESLDPGSLGSVELADINLRTIVIDATRQKMFPAYVRVEATVSEPTGEVKVIETPVQGLLKLTPSRPRG